MTLPYAAPSRQRLEDALLRRVSLRELALVLGVPTGLSLAFSLAWLARAEQVAFTDARLLTTLGIELAAAALLLPYLRRRGWRPQDVAGTPGPADVLRGAGLWLAAMAAMYVVFLTLYVVAPAVVEPLRTPRFAGTPSQALVIGVALINPVFEEFLWLGYAVPALGSRFGVRVACIVSVGLRVAVHLYQGSMAAVGILPMAAVLTWYFARTGRLWPVVVAHAIADAVALGLLSAGR